MSDAPLVYIVTLNYNRLDDTLALLASLQQLKGARPRVLVVDNASSDDSTAAIAARFPAVEQVQNQRNLGFAAGANVGLRHALAHGADWVWLLNNDTLVAPDALQLLLRAAASWDASLAAPAILYASDPHQVWSVGAWRNPATLEITGCRRGQPHAALEARPFEVDFITACGMLVRRECLQTVGLFDERFFMYYEDSDYCLRARARGQCLIVVPQARLWHKVAASIGGCDSPGERYHMALSSALFFRKHVRGRRWLIVAPCRVGSAFKTVARLLAARRPRSAWAYLRGWRDGVRT
jgi:GT2 family glycosyltransferase